MSKVLTDKDLQMVVSENGRMGLYAMNSGESHIGPTFLHVRMSDKNIFSSMRGRLTIGKNALVVKPGEIVCVESLEYFIMPLNVVGELYNRVWLGVKGLFIPNFMLDPGYRGVLRVVIVNSGRSERKISPGEYIAKLMFHELDYPAMRGVDKQNNRDDILQILNSEADAIEKKPRLAKREWLLLSIFIAYLAVFFAIYYFVKFDDRTAIVYAIYIMLGQFVIWLLDRAWR